MIGHSYLPFPPNPHTHAYPPLEHLRTGPWSHWLGDFFSQLLAPPDQLIPTAGENGSLAQRVLARLISVGVADVDANVRREVSWLARGWREVAKESAQWR